MLSQLLLMNSFLSGVYLPPPLPIGTSFPLSLSLVRMWPPLVLEVHTSGRAFTTPEGELTTENHLQTVQEYEGVNYRNKFQKTPATHSTREGHGGLARNVDTD